MSSLPGMLLPRPSLRHPYPSNPDDAREQAAQAALALATPASHDFR